MWREYNNIIIVLLKEYEIMNELKLGIELKDNKGDLINGSN